MRQRRISRRVLPFATVDVVLGLGVVLHADHGDGVERVVGLAVAAAVEPVTLGLATRGFDRAGAAERSEGGLASQAVGAVAGEREQLGGGLRPDAVLGQQPRSGQGDELVKLKLEFADFVVEHAMTAGEAAQHPLGRA